MSAQARMRAAAARPGAHPPRRRPPLRRGEASVTTGAATEPMAGELSILVAFVGGLFSFLSPCVLPLFPSYLSFITGMSVDQLQSAAGDDRGRRWILINSLAFVTGFSVVFVAMGASFSALGQLLFDYREWIRLVGGLLIIAFGLYIAGLLRLPF